MIKQQKKQKKIILRNLQSPGDIVVLAYAIKALHEQYPGKYITDIDTSCNEIFEGNPYISKLNRNDISVKVLNMEYPTINESNEKPYHFVNSFLDDLSNKLNIRLKPTAWTGAIWIKPEEEEWYSTVREMVNSDPPFWVINAGHKYDFTAKAWDFDRYQAIIDKFPNTTFVQVGHSDHLHPKLTGKNLINLVGKTDNRQLIRLVWNSFGVITPISFPMHLAYALRPHPRYNRKSRACIVIAGGREPNHWQAASSQQFVHTCGMLDCCDLGGCWKSRVVSLNDGDEQDRSLCLYPVKTISGQFIAKCMNLITTEEVCNLINRYIQESNYTWQK
jgi:ADP-heptose:LPS heptosyltransferase